MLDLLKSHPKDEALPAISIRQPWAAAVAFLGKDVENRSSWKFKYRGPILIHASATMPHIDDFTIMRTVAEEDGVDPTLLADLDPDKETFLGDLFELGAIVAVAQLEEVFGPDDEVPEDHPAAESPWADDESDYWLYFSEVVPVDPVAYKGAVGMFKVPYDVAAQLTELTLPDEE